jgi:hypothetical protein
MLTPDFKWKGRQIRSVLTSQSRVLRPSGKGDVGCSSGGARLELEELEELEEEVAALGDGLAGPLGRARLATGRTALAGGASCDDWNGASR